MRPASSATWLWISATFAFDPCVTPDGVELALLRLQPEVQDVLSREHEPHPHVLAVLKRLVLVACGRDAVEAKLPEQRQQHVVDEVVLGARVQVRVKLSRRFVSPA